MNKKKEEEIQRQKTKEQNKTILNNKYTEVKE